MHANTCAKKTDTTDTNQRDTDREKARDTS